jgi:glucarate dehydratase
VKQYSELFKELGGYKYDRDPGRPDWYTVMPEKNYADPGIEMEM